MGGDFEPNSRGKRGEIAKVRATLLFEDELHFFRHRPRRRTIQYFGVLVMESKDCSVLDTPPARGMTTVCGV
jgi:hypothetical protein